MKTFKQIIEEKILNEGGEMYPADEMTMKEIKIACYAAQNILDRLEDGAMLQRWQISAIVKAKEELASVYTSMSADEDDDEEWEDEEDPMYVGYEYPSMYGEETELDEGYNDPEYIRRAIPALKNAVEFHKDMMKDHDKKSVKGSPEYVKAHSAAANAHKEAAERHRIAHAQLSVGSKDVEYYVKPARELGAHAEKLSDKANRLKEEVDYAVDIEGLPKMYVKGDSPAQVKANLRKIVKKPDMIQSVDRVTQSMLKKIFRDKAQGKEAELDEEVDDVNKNELKAAIAAGKKKGEISSVAAVKYIRNKQKLSFTQAHNVWKNVRREIDEEAELDEAVYYTKKVYQAKGKPAEWAIIPKGQVKPVKVVSSQEEAERLARKMSTKDK
jgi:hypothetical protein